MTHSPDPSDPSQNEIYTTIPPSLDPRLNFNKREGSSGGALLSMLKSLKIGADLSKIQAPMRYLSGLSALEAKAHWSRPTNYLLEMHAIEDPVLRMESLMRHMLVNLSSSIRDSFEGGKPYNPILGEVFHATFEHEDSTTTLIAEQVSHHPPISAHLSYNLKKHFVLESCALMRMVLQTGFTLALKMVGTHNYYILNHDEKYELDGPGIRGFGMLFGPAGFEPHGDLIITNAKHNLRCKVHFGKKQKVEAKIQRVEGKKKTLLRSYKGILLGKIDATDAGSSTPVEWYNVDKVHWGYKPHVRGIEEQQENESRRVWHATTYELHANKNESAAQDAKTVVEETQREIAKKRKEDGIEFEPIYFKKSGAVQDGVAVYKYQHFDDLIREASEVQEQDEDEEMD